MSFKDIPFGRPMVDDRERDAVAKVLSGTQLVHGPVSREFEEQFALRAGAKRAVSVSSCTAGLHLSLLVSGIGAGDKVIVPAMTHVATAHAVNFCGAYPVFVDVDPLSGNIEPAAIAAAMDGDTRAVILVHYLGLPCDMDRIDPIAQQADAFVIEDCALAVDATYDGRKAGTLGRTGCFSFYPIKHITSIEGGMVTTDDEALADAIAKHKAFGYNRTLGQRSRPGVYDVDVLGYNYRMSEVHAAVGLVQLDKLDQFQAARSSNFAGLKSALDEIDEITVFEPVQGKARSSHYCLNAVLPRDGRISRAAVVDHLTSVGIGSSVHYPKPVPLMTYYREKYGYRRGQYPIAEWLADQTISLPVGPHVTAEGVKRIAEEMATAVSRASSSHGVAV